jgi:hypothetical protein
MNSFSMVAHVTAESLREVFFSLCWQVGQGPGSEKPRLAFVAHSQVRGFAKALHDDQAPLCDCVLQSWIREKF